MGSKIRREFAVRFDQKEALGEFCLLLRDERIPFQLGGFGTVVVALDEENLCQSRPERPRHFVESHKHQLVLADRDEKRRSLLNEEQTEEMLRRFIKQR